MEKEIEIKLTYKNEKEIEKKLVKMNMVVDKIVDLEDRYYSQHGESMENTNELMRIRKEGDNVELTYKGRCKDENNVWVREEINVIINNIEMMHKILLKSGFKIIKENASKRKYWKLGNTKVIFIKYSKPTSLEMIEIESDNKENIQRVMNELNGLITEVGEELFSAFDKKGGLN